MDPTRDSTQPFVGLAFKLEVSRALGSTDMFPAYPRWTVLFGWQGFSLVLLHLSPASRRGVSVS